MDDKSYKSLLKAIRSSDVIDSFFKNYLISYVSGVKNGTRNNDFIDYEILKSIILKLANGDIKINTPYETYQDKFKDIINNVKFMLPQGVSTEDYESIKRSIMLGNFTPTMEFYSIFDSRVDYEQIMNIISSDDYLKDMYDEILEYAIEVSPYCINQGVLKREIVSFMYGLKYQADYDEYYQEKLTEAKKRCGVYPVDESKIAEVSEGLRTMQSYFKRAENYENSIKQRETEAKNITARSIQEIENKKQSALSELSSMIETERDLMVNRLDEYLEILKSDAKVAIDSSVVKIIKDAKEELRLIRISSSDINSNTLEKLLEAKQSAEGIYEQIQKIIQNEPEIKKLILESAKVGASKEVKGSNAVKNVEVLSSGTNVIVPDSSSTSSIILPGFDRPITPLNNSVSVPTEQISIKPIEAFDTSIPFEKRFEKIMKEKEKREKNGEIFHKMTDELIACVMEGDWPYIYGPSGCGKTFIVDQIASLIGIDKIDNGPLGEEYNLLGYIDLHGNFRATQAFIALLYGKMLFFDEFDSGEVQGVQTQAMLGPIYSQLFNTLRNPDKPGIVNFAKIIPATVNPNFRMISTGNTTGDGRNDAYNARIKIDESVQQKMIPKEFTYDNRIEQSIFGGYSAWYNLFANFRKACDDYALRSGWKVTKGMTTTLDAQAIVNYLDHNSKTTDQIIREKFTQKKDNDYLGFIAEVIKSIYGIDNIDELPIIDTNAKDTSEIDLAKCLVYRCINRNI